LRPNRVACLIRDNRALRAAVFNSALFKRSGEREYDPPTTTDFSTEPANKKYTSWSPRREGRKGRRGAACVAMEGTSRARGGVPGRHLSKLDCCRRRAPPLWARKGPPHDGPLAGRNLVRTEMPAPAHVSLIDFTELASPGICGVPVPALAVSRRSRLSRIPSLGPSQVDSSMLIGATAGEHRYLIAIKFWSDLEATKDEKHMRTPQDEACNRASHLLGPSVGPGQS